MITVGKRAKISNCKWVGGTKEKSVQEQFEDAVWVLFANMGFLELNAGKSLSIAYDFHDDELTEPISVMAVDEETILIVSCHASPVMTEHSFASEITAFSIKAQA